ncbi:MAG: glycosyltransferase family protein [Lachnospiraceae bacterium]|nr:glycosyltransferase family protein [Lachnospiraceae bacterium]
MDERKICFITCVNKDTEYEECLYYLNRLHIPEGYQVEVLSIKDATSMYNGYNQAMQASDAKYKVYLHQDVHILEQDFIEKVIALFQKDPKTGMIGMVGCKEMPETGVMWTVKRFGGLVETHIFETKDRSIYDAAEDVQVVLLDGLLLCTQYDIPWREDLFQGWDFYDCSQCMEFTRKGYKLVVPYQEHPWCLHDCGFVNLGQYEEAREKFIREYFS